MRVLDVQAEVSQASSGAYEKFDGTLPVPQLYAGVQFQPLDWLALEAEGRGITISDDQVYSVLGRLRINIFGPAFVAGGYRYDKIDVDFDNFKVDFEIQGPFVEAGLRF